MSNPAHGYDRGFPKGGYVINGGTVTITMYSKWNGTGWSTGRRKREAEIKAIFARLAPPITGEANT